MYFDSLRHPLQNPSLTPFGFTTPLYQKRLDYEGKSAFYINRERIIAKLWDRQNRKKSPHPLPATMIIHGILPGVAQRNRITKGDFEFEGLPYLTRDIFVLNTIVQWFGTNNGDCFLTQKPFFPISHPEREFVEKLAHQNKEESFLLRRLHICTPACGRGNPFSVAFGDTHVYRPDTVSERDVAVVDGLMRWLGRVQGRLFIARYVAITQKFQELAHAKGMADFLRRRDTRTKQAAETTS